MAERIRLRRKARNATRKVRLSLRIAAQTLVTYGGQPNFGTAVFRRSLWTRRNC
jgi:hypothetical protein